MVESYPLYWPEGRRRTSSFARRNNPGFKQGFAVSRDGLLAEIKRLGGSSPILSTNVKLRGDGLPSASAGEPQDPGVAVYFTYKQKMMCFACDKYLRVRENLRGIALTIEAIRGIERWGSSDMMERAFRGFTALPETSSRHWRDVLGFSQHGAVTLAAIEEQFRRLSHIHHPDKGGSTAKFQELTAARDEAKREVQS